MTNLRVIMMRHLGARGAFCGFAWAGATPHRNFPNASGGPATFGVRARPHARVPSQRDNDLRFCVLSFLSRSPAMRVAGPKAKHTQSNTTPKKPPNRAPCNHCRAGIVRAERFRFRGATGRFVGLGEVLLVWEFVRAHTQHAPQKETEKNCSLNNIIVPRAVGV